MGQVHGVWLRQGLFVLSNDRPAVTQLIRAELERGLHLQPGTLHIKGFPVAANWRHTCWWREGHTDYAEAQFFAQIAHDFAVLSLGVSVEKGRERAPERPGRPCLGSKQLMDRRSWDWPRLVKHASTVFSTEIAGVAAELQAPINVRIRTRGFGEGDATAWATRAFSFLDGHWFERYKGRVEPKTIVEHIRELDRRPDSWAIVHFARDLDPVEANGLSAPAAAAILLAFDSVRRRLRPKR